MSRLDEIRTAEEYRAAACRAMSESDLYEQIREVALLAGWMIYHTHDSRRSYAGFPDVTLCRASTLWFLELKREGGRVTATQKEWIDALQEVAGVRAAVIYPRDLDRLRDLLVAEPEDSR